MEEKERLKFPILGAEVCPNCGSKERVGQKVIQEMKDDGKLSQAFPTETMLQVPLFDPTRPPLAATFTIPVLQIHFDVCEKCKTLYCTRINLAQQPTQVQQMPGPIGMNPGFRRHS